MGGHLTGGRGKAAMKIFVTGATGFVGSAAASALIQSGHDVIGLVRTPSKAEALVAASMRTVVGDMLDPSSYLPVVEDVDAVVQAAQFAAGPPHSGQSRHVRRPGHDDRTRTSVSRPRETVRVHERMFWLRRPR